MDNKNNIRYVYKYQLPVRDGNRWVKQNIVSQGLLWDANPKKLLSSMKKAPSWILNVNKTLGLR